MTNPQLLDYIKRHLDRNDSLDVIKKRLITEGGWDTFDVEEAFTTLGVAVTTAATPVISKPAPTITPPSFPRQPIQANPAFSPRPIVTPPVAPQPKIVPPVSVVVPQPIVKPVFSTVVPQPAIKVPTPPVIPKPSSEPVTQFPSTSKFSQSLPVTPASRTFDSSTIPVASNVKIGRSTGKWMNLVIVILVLLLGGLGVYAYFKYFRSSQAPVQNTQIVTNNTQDNSQTLQVTPPVVASIVVTNPYYSFTLPKDWEASSTSNGQGIQATKKSSGYSVSIAITSIPKTAGAINSVDQIMTDKTIPKIIDSEFPGAKIDAATTGSLGGEQAAVITFTGNSTSTIADGTKQVRSLAMKQYSAVHAGTLYTLVFIVDLSKNGTTAVGDLKEMVDSFEFK